EVPLLEEILYLEGCRFPFQPLEVFFRGQGLRCRSWKSVGEHPCPPRHIVGRRDAEVSVPVPVNLEDGEVILVADVEDGCGILPLRKENPDLQPYLSAGLPSILVQTTLPLLGVRQFPDLLHNVLVREDVAVRRDAEPRSCCSDPVP